MQTGSTQCPDPQVFLPIHKFIERVVGWYQDSSIQDNCRGDALEICKYNIISFYMKMEQTELYKEMEEAAFEER